MPLVRLRGGPHNGVCTIVRLDESGRPVRGTILGHSDGGSHQIGPPILDSLRGARYDAVWVPDPGETD